MKEKLTSRDLQAMETKEKLTRTSMELIAREGYRNVTVSRICRECGVSVGTFYQYFSAKKDIIALMARQHNEYLSRACAMEFDKSAPEIYASYVDKYMALIAQCGFNHSKALMLGMIQEEMDRGELGVQLQRDFLKTLLEYGQSRGEFVLRDMSADDFIDSFLAAINGTLAEWYFSNGTLDVVEQGRRVVGRLVRLLEPPRGKV